MSFIGTNHFVSRVAAYQYYRRQGGCNSLQEIHNKELAEEIKIGPPPIRVGETLEVIKDEGRYRIVTPD